MSDLKREIEHAINRANRENTSNTPDFILADYLMSCLAAFEGASNRREAWYGKALTIGGVQSLAADASPAPECEWREDGSEFSVLAWRACGGRRWTSPAGFIYCPFCAKPLRAVPKTEGE